MKGTASSEKERYIHRIISHRWGWKIHSKVAMKVQQQQNRTELGVWEGELLVVLGVGRWKMLTFVQSKVGPTEDGATHNASVEWGISSEKWTAWGPWMGRSWEVEFAMSPGNITKLMASYWGLLSCLLHWSFIILSWESYYHLVNGFLLWLQPSDVLILQTQVEHVSEWSLTWLSV